ncbi:hypothetical protein [Rhodobium gokarnense]|uniref:Uncharacterized protein n=1 Tax=Rhodobium gokarnense TaxID=364296 RepID=A0ABT3HC32_9HYPH|nr:hypothetical protein [Rhodobium gokarnense]MCW2307909.1 hypothetical protein [Rhodobium gokarnense]
MALSRGRQFRKYDKEFPVPQVLAPRGRTCAVLAAAIVAIALAGCARPKGDFGRAERTVVHDQMMPAVGKVMARGREEPVSDFNYTDDEREFRDRTWSIVRPMHARDWLAANKAELQRTRIVGEVDRTLDPETYYKLLRSDRYQSSEARYERVILDIRSDQDLLDPFYALLLKVQAADAERIRVARASMSATPKERHDARARVAENRQLQEWACRSLRFRLIAYRNAIDRLEIETPSKRLFEANTAWRRLASAVKACATAGTASAQRVAAEERPSRFATGGWGTMTKPQQK